MLDRLPDDCLLLIVYIMITKGDMNRIVGAFPTTSKNIYYVTSNIIEEYSKILIESKIVRYPPPSFVKNYNERYKKTYYFYLCLIEARILCEKCLKYYPIFKLCDICGGCPGCNACKVCFTSCNKCNFGYAWGQHYRLCGFCNEGLIFY